MRYHSAAAALATILFGSACPPATPTDAGAGDAIDGADGADRARDAAPLDLADPGDVPADRTVDEDARGVDAAALDAPPPDALLDRTPPDRTVDAAACISNAFDLCAGVPPSGHVHDLQLAPAALRGAHQLDLGSSRSGAEAAFAETPEPAAFNTFALLYCGEGLILYYSDNLNDTPADEGMPSGEDQLYKITAFGNFLGGTAGVSIGDQATEAATAFGAADFEGTTVTALGEIATYWFYNSGHSLLFVDNEIVAMSLFRAQLPGTVDQTMDFAAATVGSIQASHSGVLATGSTLTQIRATFGDAPDAEGETAVTIGTNNVNLVVLSYSALGLRFSGGATQIQSGDSRRILSTIVSIPFQGRDSNGIGIGSSRAEMNAAFGPPVGTETGESGVTLHRYLTGNRKTGVVYAEDSTCVERIAMIALNLISN